MSSISIRLSLLLLMHPTLLSVVVKYFYTFLSAHSHHTLDPLMKQSFHSGKKIYMCMFHGMFIEPLKPRLPL